MWFLGTSYLFLGGDTSHRGAPRPCQHCNSRAACWAEQREGAYTAFLHWQTGSRALSLQWPWDCQLQQKGKEDARVYMRKQNRETPQEFHHQIKKGSSYYTRTLMLGQKHFLLIMNCVWSQLTKHKKKISSFVFRNKSQSPN